MPESKHERERLILTFFISIINICPVRPCFVIRLSCPAVVQGFRWGSGVACSVWFNLVLSVCLLSMVRFKVSVVRPLSVYAVQS